MPLPSFSLHPLTSLRALTKRAPLILGSGSPRRREFLERAGIPFRVIAAEIEERIGQDERPESACVRLALEKAESVTDKVEEDKLQVIVAADTIVWLAGEFLGKPTDQTDAARLLRLLSGKTHTVFTGVALIPSGEKYGLKPSSGFRRSEVTFHGLSDKQIQDYIASGDPLDKAGAYGAQEKGAFLVDRIDGDLDTVIGFPLELVDQLAKNLLDQQFQPGRS